MNGKKEEVFFLLLSESKQLPEFRVTGILPADGQIT